jgi:hypothetical protein
MSLRCFTPADAALYARGYPHLVVLVEDPKKPVPITRLYNDYFGAYATHWPRSTARGFVRAGTIGPDFELDSEAATTAAARTDDIDRAEAHALIRAMLARKTRGDHFEHEHWLLCLEALAGTDVVLELLAAELAALPDDRIGVPTGADLADARPDATWTIEDGVPAVLAYCTGYLLLRASAGVATTARATLEALWQRTVDANASIEEHSPRGALDLALHGMEGARRVLPPSHWQYLTWWGFVDDTEMICTRLKETSKADFHPDPRLAWLGGVPVLELMCSKKIVRGCGVRKLSFLEQIGKFDHPAIAAAMTEWRDDKRAGAYATHWLAAHGDAKAGSKTAAKPIAAKPIAAKPIAAKPIAAKKVVAKPAPKKPAKKPANKPLSKRKTR